MRHNNSGFERGHTMKAIVVGAILLSFVPLIPSTTTYYQQVPERPFTRVQAVVTAYTSSLNETDDRPFETASGTHVRKGTLACPSKLAFGTVVEINRKKYTCLDRMNKRYRSVEAYDMWVESKQIAYQFGRQTLSVKVYAENQ